MKASLETLNTYWHNGAKVIEACLAKALSAQHTDAPFPLNEKEAKLWHAAQASAFQHALEMMGPPDADTTEDLIQRVNAGVKAKLETLAAKAG